MALIVETGSGASTSESYISVTDADTYMSNLGHTLWATMTTGEKEQALRRATNFMAQQYRMSWKGYRTSNTQALDWPRYQVQRVDGPGLGDGYGGYIDYYLSTTVPTEVANACAELALIAASGDLNPALQQNVTQKTVGPITIKYDEFSPQAKRYRSVDMLLAPFLKSQGPNISLTRC